MLDITPGGILYHIQCAYESQQSFTCPLLLERTKYRIALKDKNLTTPDFTAIGYVMSNSFLPTTLVAINCNINLDAIDAMVKDNAKQYSLQNLQLESKFDSADVSCIDKLLSRLRYLRKLNIKAREKICLSSTFHTIRDYCTIITELRVEKALVTPAAIGGVLQACNSIIKLAFIESIEGHSKLKPLADNLIYCPNLVELDVSNNRLDDEDATILGASLQFCSKLETIAISNNDMSSNGVVVLMKSIERHKCLRLDIADIQGGNRLPFESTLKCLAQCINLKSLSFVAPTCMPEIPKGLETLVELKVYALDETYVHQDLPLAISRCLPNLIHLQNLSIGKFHFALSGINLLANSIHRCPALKKFDLSNNVITSSEVGILSASLRNVSSLRVLHLNKNKLGDEGAIALSMNLQHYQNLEELYLCDNAIGQEGAEAVAANLCRCTKLKKLDFRPSLINGVAADTIKDYLKRNADLKALDFSW